MLSVNNISLEMSQESVQVVSHYAIYLNIVVSDFLAAVFILPNRCPKPFLSEWLRIKKN